MRRIAQNTDGAQLNHIWVTYLMKLFLICFVFLYIDVLVQDW